jgi:hypothetical protein
MPSLSLISYLIVIYSLGDDECLAEIVAACGASEEEMASISGVTTLPSSRQ